MFVIWLHWSSNAAHGSSLDAISTAKHHEL
jgi:hypothetical protein